MKQFTFYDIYYAPIKALDDKQAARPKKGSRSPKESPSPEKHPAVVWKGDGNQR